MTGAVGSGEPSSYAEYVRYGRISIPLNLSHVEQSVFPTLSFQRRTCTRPDGTVSIAVVVVDRSGRTLQELIFEARARVEPPAPNLGTGPDMDQGHAVAVQTALWVWTEDPVTETASAGSGMTVSVTSNLDRVDFVLSGSDYWESWWCDQDRVQVSWVALNSVPEVLLDPVGYGACHMVVRRSSTGEPGNKFNLRATATWSFTYAINGSGQIPIPGTVTKVSDHPVDAIEYLVVNR